jgi:ADP-ribosyl-[dinitrogen reductase] hydrolase
MTIDNFDIKRGKIASLEKDGLWFPPATSRMTGTTTPTKTEWISSYLGIRRGITKGVVDDSYYSTLSPVVIGSDLLDRARGTLIGAAIGDALGTTVEFSQPGTFKPVTDIVGGGPFNLKAGEWTDDTSMLLCLAQSLVSTKKFDVRWWKDGAFSVNTECFDIGNTVQTALQDYLITGNPESGPTDKYSAGNGSLMRLAPVPIRYISDFVEAVEYSGKSSVTTHGSIEAIDACRYFGGLLWGALNGASKDELLNGIYDPTGTYWAKNPLCSSIKKLLEESQYKTKNSNEVRGSGYVLHTLEAVLWAFSNSSSFEEGLLKVVNLGEDADTTGCIYGQLAGAFYGERKVPIRWVDKVKFNHMFYLKAQELLDCSET